MRSLKFLFVQCFGIFCCLISTSSILKAQVAPPEGINYQAVARDTSGAIHVDTTLSVKMKVRSGSVSGTVVYEETHSVTTNQFGLFDLVIGQGSPVSGVFSDITWSTDKYFLESMVDDGSGYQTLGTTQFMTVPYSYHSNTADSLTGGAGDGDWVRNGNHLFPVNVDDSVGIGNTNPIAPFHITSDDTTAMLIDGTNTNRTVLSLNAASGAAPGIGFSVGGNFAAGQFVDPSQDNNWFLKNKNATALNVSQDSVGIGAGDPLSQLHLQGGSFLADGAVGSTPVSGQGVRMMWVSGKQAFRAGEVISMNWDPDSIGSHSVAFGFDTKASGDFSAAWGNGALASNSSATAFGYQTLATGGRATSWGDQSQAMQSNATAWGLNTKADGSNATAWGASTEADSLNATAWGYGTWAHHNYATAWGNQSVADGNSATAWGYFTDANADYSTAWGYNVTTGATGATAWGYSTGASGLYSTAWGSNASASGDAATAWGDSTRASGERATAWGHLSEATGINSTAFGYSMSVDGDTSVGIGLDGSFDFLTQSNTFAITGGNVGIGLTTPQSYLHIRQASSSNKPAMRLGNSNQSTSEWVFRATSTAEMIIQNENGGTPIDAMFFDNNGFIGIGTTAPGYQLQVGNSGDGSIAVANAWNTFSDRRWKKDLRLVENPVEKVSRMNGYYYHWKGEDKDTARQVGVVAQEVQKVLPEVVSEDDDGYLSVDYSKLTPLLIEALKKQQGEIEEQRKQIERLKADNESAQKEKAALESKVNKMEEDLEEIRSRLNMEASK